MIIAIDGPAGSGKSTVSKRVAKKLRFLYLDTGAMYRAMTYGAFTAGVDFGNEDALVDFVNSAHVQLTITPKGAQRVLLNNGDVTEEIRDPEITRKVKFIAKIPRVRERLVTLQREAGAQGSIVAEGRDTTTVVFPDAFVKVYLDGDQKERARRRFIELQEKGMAVTYEEILQDQIERDRSDIEREVGALKKAPDALIVDTTALSVDEVVRTIVSAVKKRRFENHNPIYWIFRWPFGFIFRIWCGLTITGREHIPDDTTGFLVASNHASFIDPILLGLGAAPRQLSYLAKRSLFSRPVLGFLISLINVYPIDREKADTGALKAGIRMIHEKKGVVIFPEGTRSEDGRVQNARRKGAGFIALKTGCRVIPAYVKNSHRVMPKNTVQLKRIPLAIHFGPPVDLNGIGPDADDRYEQATQRIMDAIRALAQQNGE